MNVTCQPGWAWYPDMWPNIRYSGCFCESIFGRGLYLNPKEGCLASIMGAGLIYTVEVLNITEVWPPPSKRNFCQRTRTADFGLISLHIHMSQFLKMQAFLCLCIHILYTQFHWRIDYKEEGLEPHEQMNRGIAPSQTAKKTLSIWVLISLWASSEFSTISFPLLVFLLFNWIHSTIFHALFYVALIPFSGQFRNLSK